MPCRIGGLISFSHWARSCSAQSAAAGFGEPTRPARSTRRFGRKAIEPLGTKICPPCSCEQDGQSTGRMGLVSADRGILAGIREPGSIRTGQFNHPTAVRLTDLQCSGLRGIFAERERASPLSVIVSQLPGANLRSFRTYFDLQFRILCVSPDLPCKQDGRGERVGVRRPRRSQPAGHVRRSGYHSGSSCRSPGGVSIY